MSEWLPPDLLDAVEDAVNSEIQVENVKLPNKQKNFQKTQSEEILKNHAFDPRFTKSEGNKDSLNGVALNKKVKKSPPDFLNLGIREQLRNAGICSQSYIAAPKPINHDVTVHGRMNRLIRIAANNKLFESSGRMSAVQEEVSAKKKNVERGSLNGEQHQPKTLKTKKTRSSVPSVGSDYDVVEESNIETKSASSLIHGAHSVSSTAKSFQSNPFLPGFCDPYV